MTEPNQDNATTEETAPEKPTNLQAMQDTLARLISENLKMQNELGYLGHICDELSNGFANPPAWVNG